MFACDAGDFPADDTVAPRSARARSRQGWTDSGVLSHSDSYCRIESRWLRSWWWASLGMWLFALATATFGHFGFTAHQHPPHKW